MRIKYEDEAKLDLLGIRDYYRNVGGNQLAMRMIKQIRSDINALFTYRAPPYELVPDIHRLVVANGAFLAFHRINEAESIVEILHVRRSERASATNKDFDLKFTIDAAR
ncbi:MAG: type II toxin-antitoxin system RelE/ParE family toxin [Methylococcales bacterium]|nr:type II toxin-antitoxin system RelE/ParE family toxin [Methylococcales bacterium]